MNLTSTSERGVGLNKKLLVTELMLAAAFLGGCRAQAEATPPVLPTTPAVNTPETGITPEGPGMVQEVRFNRVDLGNITDPLLNEEAVFARTYGEHYGLTLGSTGLSLEGENRQDPDNPTRMQYLLTGTNAETGVPRLTLSLMTYKDGEGKVHSSPVLDGLVEVDGNGNQSMVARTLKTEAVDRFFQTGELDLNNDLGQIIYALNFGTGVDRDAFFDELSRAQTVEERRALIEQKVHSFALVDPANPENMISMPFPLAVQEANQQLKEQRIDQLIGFLTGAIPAQAGEVPTAEPTEPVPPTETPMPTETPQPTETPMPTEVPVPKTLKEFANELDLDFCVYFEPNSPQADALMAKEFNCGNIFVGMSFAQPTRGHFEAQVPIDYYSRFAREKGLTRGIWGAPIIWAADVPDWIKNGNFSREELTQIMTDHVTQIVTMGRGKVNYWTVVNEPYAPPYRNDDIFHRVIGPDYIEMAFRAAREADPKAKLIFNDTYNHMSGGPNGTMTQFTQEHVNKLREQGLIDGVGLQMHIDAANPPNKEDMIATMRNYGVPVYITEFDVNLSKIPQNQPDRLELQARIAADVLDACLESGVCKSFTVFGLRDNMSVWEKYLNQPNADPLLFDDNFNPKPAYDAMLEVFRQHFEKKLTQ